MKRSKEILLCLSFVAAIVLLYVGINFLKGRNVFSRNATYYVLYDNVTGLSNSSPVFTNGVRVGIVSDIITNFDTPDKIIVSISTDRRLTIPEGTVAVLETEILGTVSMNLMLAPATNPALTPGDTLSGYLDRGTFASISELMPQFARLVPEAEAILTSIRTLLGDSSVTATLHNAEHLTDEASTTLRKLSDTMTHLTQLSDIFAQVGGNLDTLTTGINQSGAVTDMPTLVARLDTAVTNLTTFTNTLTESDGTLQRVITDPAIYQHLDNICTEASDLINDIRQNPSRYIHLFGGRSK